ncbi:MAG TPA: 16S rRNA (adenine(1518)-N(6)/adenine(1519)-N(6))-dimethyltransferase RsmA [Gemmatimonadaceae bacterium]
MRHARSDLPPVRKSLGQHFLSDPRILERIADALLLAPSDTVVEIGAGRGALTEVLRTRAARVIAIELDRALAALLRERYAPDPRVTVIEADVLDVALGEMAGGPYVLIGNVPYYITTPILFHALEPPRPDRAVFLVQREVADRMVASPGSRDYGALSVNLQALAAVEKLFKVPAGAFQPPPAVESAVVRVTPHAQPAIGVAEEEVYRTFVQASFGLRRKQMRRVVRTVLDVDADRADQILQASNIAPEVRPESLTPEQFAVLLRVAAA